MFRLMHMEIRKRWISMRFLHTAQFKQWPIAAQRELHGNPITNPSGNATATIMESETWTSAQQLEMMRHYSLTKYNFDTNRLVAKLEQQGLSRIQSEGILNALTDVISESMDNVTKNMVTLAEQEKHVYMYKADFAQLKSEVHMLEKNDFAILKADNERLMMELDKLKERLREEMNKLQAGVRLDMSLDKGRIRDEAAQQDIKTQETDNRIKTEILNIRTQMHSLKFDIIKYIVGTIGTTGALFLGYLRLFK